MKKVHTCKCGCGQKYPPMPPSTWMSYISGWHRVRIVGTDGPNYSSDEIGCGNDPAAAVEEAWEWLQSRMKRARKGKCWHCNDNPCWKDEYINGDAPPCQVCGAEAIDYNKRKSR